MPRGIAKNHDEKRIALRRGAATYFSRHGYDRASMTGAAQHCGVSKALIYHYYDSKEALLFDILEAHLSDLLDVVEQDQPTSLTDLVQAFLSAYENADAEHKLQLDALATLPPELQEPLVDLQRQMVAIMSRAIAQKRPDLTGDRLRAVTMSVFGILNWFYMWHRPGKGLSRAEYGKLAAEFVNGGVMGVGEVTET
ncbi:MAG: TetR/AcrR family transcriptional regulator [Rhodobacteraceae bacterium]|nr:TetR/AcrR family transcriptional regulator [Paracoccaceae bacterium]